MSDRPDSDNSPLNVLQVGGLPPPLGGTAISLQYLVAELTGRDDISLDVVNTSGIRECGVVGLCRLVPLLWRIVRGAFRADVITLHACSSALPTIGLVSLVVARAARKKLLIRKFAGTDYMALGQLRGQLAHFAVRHADMYLAQTRRLVALARRRGVSHVRWYPTSRPAEPANGIAQGRRTGRFAYIGHVRPYKGIPELIDACERFDEADGVSVDVYGPLLDGITEQTFAACRNVAYRGVLPHERVVDTMRGYDAMLLPTKADSEGYPGVVLEAYAAGVPLICTTCGAIGEIVDETTALIVQPGDADGLYQAIKRLANDDALLDRLRRGVAGRSDDFSCKTWADVFMDCCRELAPRRQGPPLRRTGPVRSPGDSLGPPRQGRAAD